MPLQLILYGTATCHLCELAEAHVIPIARAHRLTLSQIDIAEQDGLDSYEARIPVLRLGQHELDWPFDAPSVAAFIARTKN